MTEIKRKKNTGEPGNGGQFGSKTHSEAEVQLASRTPMTASIRLEAWDNRDEIVEVDVVDIDITELLDARDLDDPSLEDITDDNYNDWVYEEAVSRGLIDHDGPYTVMVDEDDIEQYIREREQGGLTDGDEDIAESLRASGRLRNAHRRARLLSEQVQLPVMEPVLSTLIDRGALSTERVAELTEADVEELYVRHISPAIDAVEQEYTAHP